MIRIATALQAQTIDREAQENHSLNARDLMNTAGHKAARWFQKLYPDKNKKIVVLCGPGNNGGDGLVVYRELLAAKYLQLSCYFILPPKSPILIQQVRMLSKNIPIIDDKTKWPEADIYIDALFGIGLNQDISGSAKTAIENINSAHHSGKAKTFSLDIPSGICAITGNKRGLSIVADHTVTFGIYKLGQWIQDGPSACGKLKCVDIGFPKKLVKKIANTHFVYTQKDFLKNFPQRLETSNKSNYGHVKTWAGSSGMWGAALLTASAAYRIGAGYVTIESDKPYFTELPEVLVEAQSPIDNKFTYAVGPGWSASSKRELRLRELYKKNIEKVILDADALNTISVAQKPMPLHKDWILTPHTQELSRLLDNETPQDIDSDRSAAITKAVQKWNAIFLLKGFRTLVAINDKIVIIPTGNASLAKAGSGDVLTGMISGLRAQNMSAPLAAMTGAYLHGLMSDIWCSKYHQNTLTPTDLLKGLPRILKVLSIKKEARKNPLPLEPTPS